MVPILSIFICRCCLRADLFLSAKGEDYLYGASLWATTIWHVVVEQHLCCVCMGTGGPLSIGIERRRLRWKNTGEAARYSCTPCQHLFGLRMECGCTVMLEPYRSMKKHTLPHVGLLVLNGQSIADLSELMVSLWADISWRKHALQAYPSHLVLEETLVHHKRLISPHANRCPVAENQADFKLKLSCYL